MSDSDTRSIQDTINSLGLEGAAARLLRITCEQLYIRGVRDGLEQGKEITMKILSNKKGLSK